ncbi:MAG: MarR family transcriptional regulator, partial [bacterium]|nr:MarR family transcriptional regulator [bacterium]
SDLALFLQIKPPAASELVDRLVKAEFIERETNPNDRRQTILTLSDKGKRIIAQRQEQLVNTYLKMLERMKPKEQKALEQAFVTLARVAKAMDDKEAGL